MPREPDSDALRLCRTLVALDDAEHLVENSFGADLDTSPLALSIRATRALLNAIYDAETTPEQRAAIATRLHYEGGEVANLPTFTLPEASDAD